MPRVIILDTLAQEGLDLLAASPGVEFEVRTGLKGAELRAALQQCEGAICRSGVKITADVLEGNRRLKAIVRAGVGTDNIDSAAATRSGIIVMNTPGGNTLSTAEHTIALMLALSRNIAPAYQSLLAGKWERNKYMGSQVAGKTLGIVGLGRIGLAVAARARALEMKVLGYDPMVQVIHERDVVDAMIRALEPGARGIFNLRGPGELPLSRALTFLRRRPIPLPSFVAKGTVERMWRYRLTSFPSPELDHIRFLCMVDDTRAREVLGFTPKHGLKETLLAVDEER